MEMVELIGVSIHGHLHTKGYPEMGIVEIVGMPMALCTRRVGCPEMEIVEVAGMSCVFCAPGLPMSGGIAEIVGLSSSLRPGVAQKWKLWHLLECLLCSEHNGCPEGEVVEIVGMCRVFSTPRLSGCGNCGNCVSCWNDMWFLNSDCPEVEFVGMVGMSCVFKRQGCP